MMKKTLRKLIFAVIIPFFLALALSGVLAQTPLPSPSPSPNPVKEAPVVLGDETLFVIQVPQGGLSPQQRAERLNLRLQEFADDQSLPLTELQIYTGDSEGIPLTTISAGNKLLLAISDRDASIVDQSRAKLAEEYFQKIKDAVKIYRQERSLEYFLWAMMWSVIATIILIISLSIAHNVFTRIYQRLKAWGETYIRPVRLGNWELIRANQLDNFMIWLVRLAEILIIISLLLAYFPFVFRQFPLTRGLAKTFEGYLIDTVTNAWQAFITYLPNLLTIILVIVVTYVLLRLAKPFFQELEAGNLSLPGFYPEWAKSTYRLVTFLIITLAAVIGFPSLPGFQSPAFQGISVFLGLLISLGSSAVIANLVSGSVLIYTRAFRLGDRVKIGDVYGKVLEQNLLVTRILTPKNVIISIPNAQMATSSIENYSFGYRELHKPYIIRTPVYLGYEVSWQQAYQALIKAAKGIPGMLTEPEPFVLQETLNEVFVTYQLSIYIDEEYFKDKSLKEFEQIRSQLHENIRDCCAEASIRIFAPSYEADPTNYGPVKD
jgi:small-conductance mechanosensitive channel